MLTRGCARLGAALAVTALFSGAVTAQAATVIGQTGTTTAFGCTNAVLFQGDVGGPPAYVVSAPGVITSWSHEVINPSGSGKLFVVRETEVVDTVVAAAKSETLEFDTPGLLTQATRIPVVPGDAIGLRATGVVSECGHQTGLGDRLVHNGGVSEPELGEEFTGGSIINHRVNVSATVEPDADGDGFGDETQDKCPAAAGGTEGCPPALPSFDRTVRIAYKKAKFFKGKVASAQGECMVATVEVVRKKKGKAKVIGSAETGGTGKWKLRKPGAKPGKYFARVAETTGDAAICAAAQSKTIKVKRKKR